MKVKKMIKNTSFKHQSEQFVREWEPTKGGRGAKAPRPPL